MGLGYENELPTQPNGHTNTEYCKLDSCEQNTKLAFEELTR